MQIALSIAGVAVAFYIAIALSLFMFQRRLIYHPDPTRYTPAAVGLADVRETTLQTPDGVRLIAWQADAAPGQPTLIYFHGNAGGLATRAERIKRFQKLGYGVFMPAYRGYGGSEGKPSERAIVADALLAYDHLRGLGVAARDIVLYGESLGSGVAVQVAAARPAGAVILDAPYTSLPDIGKRIYPFLPVERFMIDKFDSKKRVPAVRAPILILHGTRDTTIPMALGKALFDAASQPKELALLEGAGHSDIYLFGALAIIRDFLERSRAEARRRSSALETR